jgi:ribonucleoside-diphosphate reductase alpha chain
MTICKHRHPPYEVPIPATLQSTTTKEQTGHTTLYVTVAKHEGRIMGVLAKVSDNDPCEAGYLQALCRAISVGLRRGIPPEVYIEQLQGIRCVPATSPTRERFVGSPADGIALVLKDALKEV